MTVRYWIAINGSSVACSSIPFERAPKVTPTPEVLVGFLTLERAKAEQTFLLSCHPEELAPRMRSWFEDDEIQIRRPRNPEPQTTGETLWLSQ